MWVVIVHTLRESIHRRMGLALMTIAVVVALIYLSFSSFTTGPDGAQVAKIGRLTYEKPAELLRDTYQLLIQVNANLWILLGIFAAAPSLATYLEKGWADLTLSKGIPRWQMLGGRYVGSLLIYVVSIFLLAGVPALYFWLRTGIAPGRFLAALVILAFNFAVLLSTIALVNVVIPNAGLAIMTGFAQYMIGQMLAGREMLYRVIEAQWARFLLDWLYRILPKHPEISQTATRYFATGEIADWWPIWTSAVFAACALALALWLMHRKSF